MQYRYSSPDPLNDDSFISPTLPQILPRSRSRDTPSKKNKNKRQIFELDVGNDISPQKIRVTVEAGDDEVDNIIDLQRRPVSWQKKKVIACTQPTNDTSNQNIRNKLLATPVKARGRPIKSTSAASINKSVTKSKKSPSKIVPRDWSEVNNSKDGIIQFDSEIEEEPRKGKGRSKSRSRKQKSLPQSRSKKKNLRTNVTSLSNDREEIENQSHNKAIYETAQCNEFLQNAIIRVDSGPKLVNKNKRSHVADNSNLNQEDNNSIRSKIDHTNYPSPDSPKELLERDTEENVKNSSKLFYNQITKLDHNLEDSQKFIDSNVCAEYEESDTILESEEFSLISINSVPSLKEHLSTTNRDRTSSKTKSILVPPDSYQRLSTTIDRDKTADQEIHQSPNFLPKNLPHSNQNTTSKIPKNQNNEIQFKNDSNINTGDQIPLQESNNELELPQKNFTTRSLPNENRKEPLSTVTISDFKSVNTESIIQPNLSNLLNSAPEIQLLSQSSESINPSICRLPTPKKTSSIAGEVAQKLKNQVESNKFSVEESLKDQFDIFLDQPQTCSSPVDFKYYRNNGTPHQDVSRYTSRNTSNHQSTIFSSPSLPSLTSRRNQSSHDRRMRIFDKSITKSLSIPGNSSSPQRSNSNSNSLLSPFLSPFTDRESKLSRAVDQIPLSQKNCQEFLSQNHKDLKSGHTSEASALPDKLVSINDNQRLTLEARKNEMNSYSTYQDINSKATKTYAHEQNDISMGLKSKKLSSMSEQTYTSNFNSLSPRLGNNEEKDFDLLLETINSATPQALRPIELNKVLHELPNTPKSSSFRWLKTKKAASSDKFSELNNSTKKIQNFILPKKISASKRSGNSFDENMNVSNYQIPQKSNFRPVVSKKRDSSLTCLNLSPVEKLPETTENTCNLHPVTSNLKKSLQRHNSKTDSNDSLSSSGHDVFSPSSQSTGFSPRSKASLFSTETFHKTSSPRCRRQSSVLLNFMSQNHDITHKSSKDNLSSRSYSTDPKSSSIETSDSNKEKNLQENFPTGKQIHTNTKITPQNQKSPRTPTTSPTKSCLRSPLKSQTGSIAFPRSPSKVVTFVSSSPTPSSAYNVLSAKTWSRDHWILLDDIVQQWRLDSQRENSSAPERCAIQNQVQKPRFKSTRVKSHLLGKHISSAEGERMKLEQWHLEIVDQFRGAVPGWDEKVVAVRLFALLVGERVRAERDLAKKNSPRRKIFYS
ncbi:hypothetical protein EV44_g3020 [Erysiphe necator]|uniref:Uncharacterized protein n=1 Tax=Uncinula necator TaxID=52586 RepID=A0A0B1P321_UNCNE|nr:hypothetical protein EV44_g3020 [Erysiphe necator]